MIRKYTKSLTADKHTLLSIMPGLEEGLEDQTSPKNLKAKGYLLDTDLDTLENHKATQPTFNVEPSSDRQQNADDGPRLVVYCFLRNTSTGPHREARY